MFWFLDAFVYWLIQMIYHLLFPSINTSIISQFRRYEWFWFLWPCWCNVALASSSIFKWKSESISCLLSAKSCYFIFLRFSSFNLVWAILSEIFGWICRGYYKCSTVRGCPARKHVERCLQDPAMLIVTYEGEHYHPRLPSQSANAWFAWILGPNSSSWLD